MVIAPVLACETSPSKESEGVWRCAGASSFVRRHGSERGALREPFFEDTLAKAMHCMLSSALVQSVGTSKRGLRCDHRGQEGKHLGLRSLPLLALPREQLLSVHAAGLPPKPRPGQKRLFQDPSAVVGIPAPTTQRASDYLEGRTSPSGSSPWSSLDTKRSSTRIVTLALYALRRRCGRGTAYPSPPWAFHITMQGARRSHTCRPISFIVGA